MIRIALVLGALSLTLAVMAAFGVTDCGYIHNC